ncbi:MULTISPECIES: hypothetical protein [Streptomyces]|uniref:Lipoprotein n=1 Tax=Streptomyces cacaoi TaxID=1898 RepID=A0A4Y3QVZ3_STRCI|nr:MULTISPECIES: hypothetical protein [Streptomyces]NNG87860.1 hypothetical protein [Streptomyces cacaoi]QHF97668.1 hypothetical protein DEH18_31745 [Streptomyces sp. NHF165]GEB48598.1 hypothetical protein SCA03_11490 [Streptomyces cacaoi]
MRHTRLAAPAACVCATALALALSGCSVTEKLTTGLKVKHAFEKLGEQPTASVLVTVDGDRADSAAFLRAAGAPGGPGTRRAADLLSRGELAFAVGSDREETPLRDLNRSERLRFATAVNFGGKDVLAAKSVEEKLYVRVNLRSLAAQTNGSAKDRRRAKKIVALADDLPLTLRSAKDALKGKWVEVDPESFDDFARAAQEITRGEKKSIRGNRQASAALRGDERTSEQVGRATGAGRALNGESEREFLDGLEKTLGRHAEFRKAGERGGAEHVTVTVPAREAAPDLSRALAALGAHIDPDQVPEKQLRADLQIRRGQLTGLTVDLGQFVPEDGGKRVHLPLRMVFGGGDAVTVEAPDGARELQPQDLLAAVMYGALGTRGL